MLMGRSEFLTPYTPYQPEISQGGLQVMFEYQTAICELTALPVSNASVYEGPSAVAAAAYLAKLANGKPQVVVSRGVHPHSPRDAAHAGAPATATRSSRSALRDGVTDPDAWAAAIDQDTSAVIFQQPNFLGAVEDAAALAAAAKDSPARRRRLLRPDPARHPQAAGRVRRRRRPSARARRSATAWTSAARRSASSPRPRPTCGACPAASRARRATSTGRRGFVLTLQTREQHIRREKATSNICTAQALNALAGVVYLTWLGRRGLVELGELLLQRTHYAREALTALDGVEALHEQPVVREFAVRLERPPVDKVDRPLPGRGRQPGLRPGASTTSTPTACSWRSPSSARRPTSTGWPTSSAPRWRRERAHDRLGPRARDPGIEAPTRRDAAAARGGDDDLREGRPGAPRVRVPASSTCPRSTGLLPDRFRRARARAPARGLRARARAPLRQPARSATSTSTRASTRSARAR